MNRPGIRGRLWLAAALPALLAIALLVVGFFFRHGNEMTEALRDRARASARQLAGAAEFPLFAGHQDHLRRLVQATLVGDGQMRGAGLYDAEGRVQAVAGRFSLEVPTLPGPEQVLGEEALMVVVPVPRTDAPVDELFHDPGAATERRAAPLAQGYAVVELSLDNLMQQRRHLLWWALATACGGLLLAGLLSVWIASGVTGPIGRITRVVVRIGQGELGARADVQDMGALAGLATGINAMAARLAVTQDDLRRQVALATEELRRQKEAAEQAARIDPLTGLISRRAFTEQAETDIQRALRYDQPLALVMIDLDHFKAVNDNHGHLTGDAVLASFARTLNQQVRDVDVVARLGGEEFIVLLPNTTGNDAVQVAERMREAVLANELHVQGQRLRYTASFGVAAFHPSEPSLTDLMRRADAALYTAKRQGRNRVVLAPPPGSP